MCDELVKRLHRHSENLVAYKLGADFADAVQQAADAIEELTRENESLTKSVNEASEILRRRWIPVTERKPKTDDIVIVALHDDSGDTPYDVTNVGFYLDVFPLGIWVVENERCNYVTHWMSLPEPPKEEN